MHARLAIVTCSSCSLAAIASGLPSAVCRLNEVGSLSVRLLLALARLSLLPFRNPLRAPNYYTCSSPDIAPIEYTHDAARACAFHSLRSILPPFPHLAMLPALNLKTGPIAATGRGHATRAPYSLHVLTSWVFANFLWCSLYRHVH